MTKTGLWLVSALAESCRLHTPVIPDLTIGLLTLRKKTIENAEINSSEKNIDSMTQYEKIKVESFKENILKIYGITLRK